VTALSPCRVVPRVTTIRWEQAVGRAPAFTSTNTNTRMTHITYKYTPSRPIKLLPLSRSPCALSLLSSFRPSQAASGFAFASRLSNRYHGHSFNRVRKKGQGSRPPRDYRLHDLDPDRCPHPAILAYLLQPVSSLPHSMRPQNGTFDARRTKRTT